MQRSYVFFQPFSEHLLDPLLYIENVYTAVITTNISAPFLWKMEKVVKKKKKSIKYIIFQMAVSAAQKSYNFKRQPGEVHQEVAHV